MSWHLAEGIGPDRRTGGADGPGGHRLVIADVFADRPFAGNPLGVLPDPHPSLDAAAMGAVAAELGYSETTFVNPVGDGRFGVRIFTPSVELPFAGHPSVGTAAVLVHLGEAPQGKVVLAEAVGDVEVDVAVVAPGRLRARLSLRPQLRLGAAPAPAQVAAALGMDPGDVVEVWSAGVGVDFVVARVRSAAALDGAVPVPALVEAAVGEGGRTGLYVVAGDPVDGGRLGARMWSPQIGTSVAEDPATGSAAAALVASVAERTGRGLALTIDQGVVMGRPSRLEASATVVGGRVERVSVGGSVVVVAEGRLLVP